MKIAFLNKTSGIIERGAENVVAELSKRLNQNHEVVVYADRSKPARRWPFLWRFFVDPNGLDILRFTLKKLPELWREKFEIIIPTDGGWEPAFIRLLTWIRGGKMVIIGHSGPGWDDRNNLWSFPNVFVALSFQAKKWAGKANPFVRTVVIPNGIDLRRFKTEGEKVKIALERPIILMVGAPEKGKRMDLAIKAVSRLAKGSLLILGGGYEEQRIRKLGKRLLGKRFLMKQVDFVDIPKYYRSVDLFTLPSWKNEAFGIVYLEAMASNLPVVATNDELRREIVGEAGILVDPTDVEFYAKSLDKALKTDWGNKPRKQAEKFSWDKVVEKYERLFKSLVR